MTKMELLDQAYAIITKYTDSTSRPGLTDLWTYDTIIGMHNNDYEDVDNMSYIWTKTPDEVMQYIVEANDMPADLEYGWDNFDEGVREYLVKEGFVRYAEDVTEEELKANLEQRIN